MKVGVIGGGISGLTTAFYLGRLGADVVLYESSNRLGGNIRTVSKDGFLLEYGPNSLLASVELVQLIKDLDISDEILAPEPWAKNRFIIRDGKVTALPARIIDLLTTSAFTRKARLRLLVEPLVGSRSTTSESVSGFFRRRLGSDIVDYAVDPFISGIYAGDPDRLSISNAFPRVCAWEKTFGSVIVGAVLRSRGSKRPPKNIPRTFTLRNGIETLITALDAALENTVRKEAEVSDIRKTSNERYEVVSSGTIKSFDRLVISTPAMQAADLVRAIDPSLGADLATIYYPPISVIHTGYPKRSIRHPLNGFGVLMPSVEKRKILGALFSSSVFAGRAPNDHHLITTFVGGSRAADLCDKSDDELLDLVNSELTTLLGIGSLPTFFSIRTYLRSIPQYNIGYESISNGIARTRASNPGIFFCTNFYKGISVSDCVKNAVATASEVMS